MKHVKLFEHFINEAASSINALKKALPGLKFETADFELDPEDEYKTVESFYVNVPGISGEYGEDDLYINIYDGNEFCFFHDSAPVPTSLHSSSDANRMAQTQMEIPLPLSKLNKKIFDEVVKKVKGGFDESRVNEAINSSIKPNAKLKSATGYPYAMFYLSTQAKNIMVNFEDTGHVSLIKLLADQDGEMKNDGSLSTPSISKGRNLFKKVLGESIVYNKYDGADCTFRLSSTPSTDLSDGKKEWFSAFAKNGEGLEMEKYID